MNIPKVIRTKFVFKSDKNFWWSKTTHAYLPTPIRLAWGIRVFYAGWDESNVGRIGFIDLDLDIPEKIRKKGVKPVLHIGEPGTFCDTGISPSCIRFEEITGFAGWRYSTYVLYYIGWQHQKQVDYTLFVGRALGLSGGLDKFEHESKVPFLDRSDKYGLFIRTAPFVLHDRIYYTSGSRWVEPHVKLGYKKLPFYDLRCKNLIDGTDIKVLMTTPLKSSELLIGIGRSYIWQKEGLWRGLFSVRYLRNHKQIYEIMYSESQNGLIWAKLLRFMPKPKPGSWDSEMQCFPCIVESDGKAYMFYNGNNFGEAGFGYAELGGV